MKLPQLLALVCSSMVVVLSESTEPKEQELLARASAQLERLAPYRRAPADQGPPDEQWQALESAAKAKDAVKAGLDDRQMAFEIYRILPESMQKDIARRVGADQAVIELLADPKYMALMQERIKRSGSKGSHGTKRDGYGYGGYDGPPPDGGSPPEEYGGYAPEYGGGEHHAGYPQSFGSDSGGIIKGSGSLIGGIAKGIISGLVSASGSASKGSSSISAQSSSSSSSASSSSSSSENKPEYGHAYSYGDKAFDVWDFKKAIISTLMQAVKAISGGVIALKGQLIKGSGYLVATKGKMLSSTGDAITSLGRNIAKNAVRPPEPPHHGYPYDHPPGSHEESYDGPPPSFEDGYTGPTEYHGNSNYESAPDVDDQAGLLIVKPTNPDHHDDHPADADSEKPPSSQLEDSYHGPPPESANKEVVKTVVGSIDIYESQNNGNHPPDRPPSSYDVPIYQLSLDDQNKGHAYTAYPPLSSPFGHDNPLSIQQSVEYPPIHIRYTLPNKGGFDLPSVDTSSNDLSVYSSLSISPGPELPSIKLPSLDHGGGFGLPKLQPLSNFHSQALHGPLKVPLLNSYPLTPYWQNQALPPPFAGFDMHALYRRKSSPQRRRAVKDVANRMRLHRV
ncbi:uncharacterized protein LOC143378853 isoform X2 [Andrena cerasifolii]|uniref:uncharacterized protein LOC143378853 isoform X2 n=1 Tax=Andrena cerasifolii TaxID=2819439 RepID=UPI0040383358